MKKFIAFVVILSAGFWFFGGKLFGASMPPIQMSASHVLVGKAPGDHALYTLNAPCDIHAASVGYDFNPSSMGEILPKLGARAIISFMDAGNYRAIASASANTGNCMAGYLNDCQHKGEIQHLLLVPQTPAALDQMRRVSIAAGQEFHLKGRYLAFQEGTIGGHEFHGEIAGTGYFLVESIRQD